MTSAPQPAKMQRVVITLALGPDIYRAMAINLARSIRRWHGPEDLPIWIISDSGEPLPNDLKGVTVQQIKSGEFGEGFETKLHLDQLAPAAKTLFIDADCLVYTSLNSLFAKLEGRAVAVVGAAIGEGEWFGDIGALCRQLGVTAIPKFNGGLYYLEPGPIASAVYAKARELAFRYDELGLVRLRGQPNDELIMAAALALHSLPAVPDDGSTMSDPQACRGPMRVNVLRGKRRLENPPPPSPLHQAWYPFQEVQPAIVHYLGHFVRGYHYRAETLRLRLAVSGWPQIFAGTMAAFIIVGPGWLTNHFKKALRPLLHSVFGPRRIRSTGR
ncbi:MAG: hypothetical protein QM790_08370 [Nibricoccus sp.]